MSQPCSLGAQNRLMESHDLRARDGARTLQTGPGFDWDPRLLTGGLWGYLSL